MNIREITNKISLLKDSLTYLVQQLLNYNKITVDKKELAFQIQSHPSYPSLHAITGVLSHFNIDNLALNIPVDQGTLEQLPNSFLAQIKTEEGDDFVVVNKTKSHCTVLTSKKKKIKLTNNKFIEKFTGIIVAVEKDELLESATIKKSYVNLGLLVLSLLLFASLFIISKPSLTFLAYFVLSTIGIVISYSIIKQEQGHQTILGNAFCNGALEKKDCDAVIDSKGALLFKNFKLSSLSFIYFSGILLSSFLLLLNGNTIDTLYFMSVLALPITIYSIYYQAVIIKKWCFLCLGIVGTLWIQAAIVLLINKSIAAFDFNNISLLIVSFGFITVVNLWNLISPKIKSLKELDQTKVDYFKFKRNFNLFNLLLEKSESIDTIIPEVPEIIFGNKNALLNITVITNPFCGHCKSVHTLIEDVYRKYLNEVQITVRFNINIVDTKSDVVNITCKLLELFTIKDPFTCLDAMHDIYGEMDSKNWFKKWGNCNEKEQYLIVLNKEKEWCKNYKINFTPEILINGKSFPNEYNRNDLIYFIEDLIEESEPKNFTNKLKQTI